MAMTDRDMIGQRNKVVLVSGASSGLGLATAMLLYQMGFTVYAGARSYQTESTQRNPGEGAGVLHQVYLDVTDETSIGNLVRQIVEREGGIDVLVNCAAIIILGSAEDLTMEEYGRVIDTNLYGTIRMCRMALPHMRERGHGLIINFSSGAGIIGIPFQSAYCSSKFAIEGFSEALRWEVKNHGIDVVVMEPGDSKSGSKNYRNHSVNAAQGGSAYREDFLSVTKKIESDEENGAEPILAARKITRIINAARPKIRYNVFRLVENLLPMKMILPTWLIELIFFGYYNLKPKQRR